MRYYKIVHKDTNTLMLCVECEPNDNADDLLDILGSEYIAVEITKEEYGVEAGESEYDSTISDLQTL